MFSHNNVMWGVGVIRPILSIFAGSHSQVASLTQTIRLISPETLQCDTGIGQQRGKVQCCKGSAAMSVEVSSSSKSGLIGIMVISDGKRLFRVQVFSHSDVMWGWGGN